MADIFLSYSTNDNYFPPSWIDDFHGDLEKIARVYLGRSDFDVWKDRENFRGANLPAAISAAVNSSTFFMAIISPSYFEDQSNWCTTERNTFIDEVVKDLEKSKERIFAVLKIFDDKDDEKLLPPELQTQFRFRFCRTNDQNVSVPIVKGDPEWDKNLIFLAANIRNSLKKMKEGHSKTGFLAWGSELYNEQLRIKAELEQLGTTINTLMPNVKEPEKWKSHFIKALSNCTISIHLLGSKFHVKHESTSLEAIQWEWAIEQSKRTGLKVITWLPKDLAIESEDQKAFIDSIKSRDDLPMNHDLMEKGLEEFLVAVKGELE